MGKGMVSKLIFTTALASGYVMGIAQSDGLVKISGAPDLKSFTVATRSTRADRTYRIMFPFRQVDQKGIAALVNDLHNPSSPNFHHWISASELGKRFGAPDADLASVKSYLVAQGFTDITVADNKSYISATGNLNNIEKALHVRMAEFVRPAELMHDGDPETFYAPMAQPAVPKSIATKVTGVLGLSDLALMHPAGLHISPATPRQASGPFTPQQISKAYGNDLLQNAGLKGDGMNIAVFSPTQWSVNDANLFAKKFGFSGYSIYSLTVDGGSTSNAGASEAALDVEMIIGQAPHSSIYLLNATGNTVSEIDAFNALVASSSPIKSKGIRVLSSSWGFEEATLKAAGILTSFATSILTATNTLNAAGVTTLVASGDSGAYARKSNTVTTTLESSCPSCTAVGGTQLSLTSAGAYASEVAWSYISSSHSGGGGGLSSIYLKPSWQTGPGVANSYSNGSRQVPDIAANASGNSPYQIYIGGSLYNVWGTSASAPLWAANLLVMNQGYKTATNGSYGLGNLNPALYILGQNFETSNQILPNTFYNFHDITIGTNGLMPATATWDYCTGFGSANFAKLYYDLGSVYGITSFGPDYVPYTNSGWKGPILLSVGTTNEPATIHHTDKVNFAYSIANTGVGNAPLTANTLSIDGKVVSTSNTPALLSQYSYYTATAYTTTLATGKHTITLTVNSSGVRESNKTNNVYTRTITVVN